MQEVKESKSGLILFWLILIWFALCFISPTEKQINKLNENVESLIRIQQDILGEIQGEKNEYGR